MYKAIKNIFVVDLSSFLLLLIALKISIYVAVCKCVFMRLECMCVRVHAHMHVCVCVLHACLCSVLRSHTLHLDSPAVSVCRPCSVTLQIPALSVCRHTHTLMQARTSSPVMSSTASSMATGSEGGGGQIFSAWEEMKSVKIAANVSGRPSAGGGRSLRPAMGQHSPNGKSGSLACSDAHCPAGRWE